MNSPESMRFSGETANDVFHSCNDIAPRLPPDIREKFTVIRLEYMATYGFDKAHDLLRGRTAQEVIDEYVPCNVEPIESGEVDGVKYRLYEAPGEQNEE